MSCNCQKNDSIIDSHIQMPKLLLKRFHNDKHKFYYYDVPGCYIGKNGTAESTNTELGYYSAEVEQFINDTIESPIGKILAYVDEKGFDKETLSVTSKIDETVKNFFCSLISRDPSLIKKMHEEGSLITLFSERDQHDYAAINGILLSQEANVFSEYIVTFMINRTTIPFVLPVCGLYSFSFNGHTVINLPVSPETAICLIHRDYAERLLHKDGAISMFEISDEVVIHRMNGWAFSAQLKQKYGRIVCPSRNELDRLKKINDSAISNSKPET